MHRLPARFEKVPLAHVSHTVLPSVLDQPAGQDTHARVPLSNVPGAQARVPLQTLSLLQSIAVRPCTMATEEDPPAAMKPASGLLQFGWPSYSWSHPLGQLLHVIDAFRRAYLPGLQGKQSTEPSRGAYDPGGHGVRPLSTPAHLKPFSQATVMLIEALT